MQLLNYSMLKSNFSELIFMEWQIKSFSSLESQSPKDIPIKFLLPPNLPQTHSVKHYQVFSKQIFMKQRTKVFLFRIAQPHR